MPPKCSTEYFLDSIHWLDAITPPLEKHLQRLAETVKHSLDFNQNGIDAPAPFGEVQQAVASPNGMSVTRAVPAGAQREDSTHRKPAELHRAPRRQWAALGALCVLIAMGRRDIFYFQPQKAVPRDGRYSGEIRLGPFRRWWSTRQRRTLARCWLHQQQSATDFGEG